MTDRYLVGSALVLGRALHAPWNEGTRVIAWNFARVVGQQRPVRVISLTQESFRGQTDDRLSVDHVYTRLAYGAQGDYTALPGISARARSIQRSSVVSAVHLVGLPLVLAPVLRRGGARVVAHVALTSQAYMGWVERLRARWSWRLFDRWIDAYACTSEQIRADLAAQGYSPDKLHIVPPAIDTQRFIRANRDAARRELGIDRDAFVVAYVGTISPLRFPAAEIMRALGLAAGHIPKLALEVFAPVRTHTYNIAWAGDHVRQAAEGVGFPVHVHLQDLSEAQKVAVFNAADVTLLPFTAPVAVEPPLTLLEAMACEAATAVTPFANRSQVVRDGVNGLTYSSAEHLAEQLVAFYKLAPARRSALAASARASIERHYSFTVTLAAAGQVWSAIGMDTLDVPAHVPALD